MDGSNEKGSSARHEQGWHCRGVGIWLRAQEISLLQSTCCLGQCCHTRSEKDGEVYASRFVRAEDSYEASNEGGQEGNFRKSGHGEGEASKKDCKGLPRQGVEDLHLKLSMC